MTDEITTANADAEQSSVATNMTVSAFANRRIGELTPKQAEEPAAEEVTEEIEEAAPEETTEENEVVETGEEIQEDSEDVLSQIDLDTMSEDELRELSEKLGSKAVARFGALTAKRKAAEERLAELEARLKEQDDPLKARKKVDNNPFANLETVEELQSKSEEVEQIVEWAEDLLFESDSYTADDVITEVDGKELTKADVRRHLLQARKSQKTFLPDQLSKVQARVKGEELEVAFSKRAEEELSWMTGDDNDTRRQFQAITKDPRFEKLKGIIKKESPDIAGQLDYFFAHAANSMYGRKLVKDGKPGTALNPPRTGPSSSARSDKRPGKNVKALKDLQARFRQSGNPRDYAEMRKLQLTNR
jgi:hypothetical protein|tara:strand:- start:1567 stop:2649 length:1083 start_codon:yes stop_codon:yes gene_type:complete